MCSVDPPCAHVNAKLHVRTLNGAHKPTYNQLPQGLNHINLLTINFHRVLRICMVQNRLSMLRLAVKLQFMQECCPGELNPKPKPRKISWAVEALASLGFGVQGS